MFHHQIQLNLPIGRVQLSCFCHVWLLVILWTVTCPAPLSMGFFRQEYWSGLRFSLKGGPGGIPEPSWLRDQTHISYVSCIGRQVLYHYCHLGNPTESIPKVFISQFVLGCFSCFSHVQLFLAHSPPDSSVHGVLQTRLLSGLPCAPPGDLPYPEVKLESLMFPALEGRFSTTSTTWETPNSYSKFNS